MIRKERRKVILNKNNDEQLKKYVDWCNENNLEPNQHVNLKRYLKEEKRWGTQQSLTQTKSRA